MFFSMPIQWYHSHNDPIWPDDFLHLGYLLMASQKHLPTEFLPYILVSGISEKKLVIERSL
jgi:hypothetical protein